MALFDKGMMEGADPRGFLAKLIMMLRGGGSGSSALPGKTTEFPSAPGGAPTDMSMAGPWGAGFPPVPAPTPRPEPEGVPVPMPRPDPDHVLDGGGSVLIGTSQGRPDPRKRGTQKRLNRGQY